MGLSQYLMVEILIRNVRIRRTRSGYATYKYKQHHEIGADLLAQEWGIGLDKVKLTLQSTTKDNMRLETKTLTWRYRIDLLLQRLHRLNFGFYTDTLFAKDKSIVGHECAQIFTDWEFVQITPIRSKLDSRTTLYSINWDVGVTKEIFMDNKTNQTDYNTETKGVAREEICFGPVSSIYSNLYNLLLARVYGWYKVTNDGVNGLGEGVMEIGPQMQNTGCQAQAGPRGRDEWGEVGWSRMREGGEGRKKNTLVGHMLEYGGYYREGMEEG